MRVSERRRKTASARAKVPANSGFKDDVILVEAARQAIALVGPSKANLKALRAEWRDWLARTTVKIAANSWQDGGSEHSQSQQPSPARELSGKGDTAHWHVGADYILAGLNAARIAERGELRVDVLKVPHRGSTRNATRDFFRAVTADTYVVSAGRKNGNLDLGRRNGSFRTRTRAAVG
jgi:hypothetical protein